MVRFSAPSIVWLALAVAALVSCQGAQRKRSLWPPDDFEVDLKYTVITNGRTQVRKHARIFADGLVVYREADTSIRSADGKIELPIYRRVSAYRMDWKSIRMLVRDLHEDAAKDLGAQLSVPSTDEKTRRIGLRLIYMANVVDVVAENQMVGLMNSVVRVINARLPKEHPITMPNMLGKVLEHRLQDVPPVTDSVVGAKRFHETWLGDNKDDAAILRDTFALACEAKDWSLAKSCVARIVVAEPAVGAALDAILAARRSRPQ